MPGIGKDYLGECIIIEERKRVGRENILGFPPPHPPIFKVEEEEDVAKVVEKKDAVGKKERQLRAVSLRPT